MKIKRVTSFLLAAIMATTSFSPINLKLLSSANHSLPDKTMAFKGSTPDANNDKFTEFGMPIITAENQNWDDVNYSNIRSVAVKVPKDTSDDPKDWTGVKYEVDFIPPTGWVQVYETADTHVETENTGAFEPSLGIDGKTVLVDGQKVTLETKVVQIPFPAIENRKAILYFGTAQAETDYNIVKRELASISFHTDERGHIKRPEPPVEPTITLTPSSLKKDDVNDQTFSVSTNNNAAGAPTITVTATDKNGANMTVNNTDVTVPKGYFGNVNIFVSQAASTGFTALTNKPITGRVENLPETTQKLTVPSKITYNGPADKQLTAEIKSDKTGTTFTTNAPATLGSVTANGDITFVDGAYGQMTITASAGQNTTHQWPATTATITREKAESTNTLVKSDSKTLEVKSGMIGDDKTSAENTTMFTGLTATYVVEGDATIHNLPASATNNLKFDYPKHNKPITVTVRLVNTETTNYKYANTIEQKFNKSGGLIITQPFKFVVNEADKDKVSDSSIRIIEVIDGQLLVNSPTVATKDGFKLDGWKDLATGEKVDVTTVKATGPKTFEAIITEDKQVYDLDFDVNLLTPYLNGDTNGTVRPDAYITRAELASIISRGLTIKKPENQSSESKFSDVMSSKWYASDIVFITELGLIEGYSDGTFRPDNTITRAELATIIMRVEGLVAGATTSLNDVDGHWAYDAIASAEKEGIINGYPNGTFAPDKSITRAEVVKMMNSVKVFDRAPIYDESLNKFTDLKPTHWAFAEIIAASNEKVKKS